MSLDLAMPAICLPLLGVLQENRPSGRRKRKVRLQEGMTMRELIRALDTTQSAFVPQAGLGVGLCTLVCGIGTVTVFTVQQEVF